MVIPESPAKAASRSPGASKRRAVHITGRGTDIAFVIDEEAPFDQVAHELGAQLAGQSALFSRGGISVNTGKRRLSDDELAALRRVFKENSGLKISRFVSSAGDFRMGPGRAAEETPTRDPWRYAAGPSGGGLGSALTDLTLGNQRNRSRAMLIRGTFRSGESIHHHGDVIVLGDVNPGSEILADGDVVVMGTLKGLSHAGAAGDNKAAIIALEIVSPRLRIGNCEAATSADGRSAGGRKRGRDSNAGRPIIAYVRRGAIYLSPFAGRFASYTKGVPYDG